ncbi:2-dehydropantoate 2-reductase [Vibrio hangzhouensis]|uniref:2-dehydropantoate 2-reductase n=1 Tax=Vibrio hangzhouensis TaxID=462991 RepID=UPI000CDE83CA|nr:2-dehydropantoate 2-reductase [Vibrio hangzhouensis]
MNITILGPGAVGTLYAYKLHQAGHNVSVWGRTATDTVTISIDQSPEVALANRSRCALKQCDLLIVTLKAWQVEQALTPLLSELDSDTILLFLHNGLGTVDRLARLLEAHPVLLGTTTHGALKQSAINVKHTGLGQTLIGGWNDKGRQCKFVAEVMNHAFAPVKWHPEVEVALWTKLVINCAINPLTAIHQCQNGQLAASQFSQTIYSVIDEAVDCANVVGISLNREALHTTVYDVITATAQNYSSMHQDIYNKRQSEIDFISGYLVSIAEHHGIAIPTNLALYNQIKQIESSWSSHD